MGAKRIPRKIVWWVYLARCSDGSLYCGVTTDLERRFGEHNHSPKGARYTRCRRPVEMVWSQKQKTRSAALKREYAMKQMSRREKEALIEKRTAASGKKTRIDLAGVTSRNGMKNSATLKKVEKSVST